LDLVVSDAVVDIVAAGFDAGIQLGEVIDRDMIALPVTGDIRRTGVGAPSYFARRPKPKHPRDLVEHECLNWHPTAEALPYGWEFTEGGRELTIAAPGSWCRTGRNSASRSRATTCITPHRRHVSPALRALIDHLRPQRAGSTRKRSRLGDASRLTASSAASPARPP
jgi:DNA-binding transcriptional LysR family regulator